MTAIVLLSACSESVYIFDGLEGPTVATPVIAAIPAKIESYAEGETSRLAILITEDDSNWLALTSGLKTIGIPFRMTTNIEDALRHDIVMVYPQITGLNLAPGESKALRKYTENGGTLIGTNILGGGLSDLFGFETIEESKERYRLIFQSDLQETQNFESRGLSKIKIGSITDMAVNPGTNSYLNPSKPPIAVYENGEAAIILNEYGAGRTYALGIDFGQLLSKGYNRRQVGIAESYANEYHPVLDSLLIFLENIYKNQDTPKVTLGTVPDGKSLSFILSHDVDFSKSLVNAIPYAEHQKSENLSGTYFIQTKYVRDYNDIIFMDQKAAEFIEKLDSLGAEIASHSVAHSNAMWDFEMGDGTEYYPKYRPSVRTAERTTGATILGELRVSKFLLDEFSRNQKVESFRPGFLSNPSQMPQALASSGYKYSSSVTANVSLTHLPFQLTYDRAFSAHVPVFEIPITVEDELDAPMYGRMEEGIQVARQIAEIGGVYVALIHTDDVDTRLDFQKEIVDEVRPYAWMGSMKEFGDWWSARDKVSVDVVDLQNSMFQIKLDAPTPIEGLVIELNSKAQVEASSLPMNSFKIEGNNIIIDKLSGNQSITFKTST